MFTIWTFFPFVFYHVYLLINRVLFNYTFVPLEALGKVGKTGWVAVKGLGKGVKKVFQKRRR